jgi:8-oxo-dGTP pyrophosphatase MutT (NUDIX family)
MASEKLFHVGVKALIQDREGKYLIAEVDNTKFLTPDPVHGDLIGGRIQVGQGPLEALEREVEEEIGVTELSAIKFLTALVSPLLIPISQTEKVGLLLMIYKVRIPDDAKLTLSEEHTKFEWLDKDAAAAALEFKFGKEFSAFLQDGAWGD